MLCKKALVGPCILGDEEAEVKGLAPDAQVISLSSYCVLFYIDDYGRIYNYRI